MMRTRSALLLVTVVALTSCDAALTSEEQTAAGTYNLSTANGKPLPATIGKFLTGNGGADVIVTGAKLVLASGSAKLTVDVSYYSVDPVQGPSTEKRTDSNVGTWSANAGTVVFKWSTVSIEGTTATVGSNTATVTASHAGLFGAGSPNVVLLMTKQ